MGLRNVLPVMILASACATGSGTADAPRRTIPPPSDADHGRVGELRDVAARSLPLQANALWTAWIQGAPLEASGAGVDLQVADLGALQRVAHAAPPASAPHLLALERWALGELLAQGTADTAAEVEAAAEAARFSFEDETWELSRLHGLLAAQADPDRRTAIVEAALPAAADLLERHRAHGATLDEASQTLGYPSAIEAAAALRGLSTEQVEALADDALEATDELHRAAFGDLTERILETELDEVRERDVPRMRWGLQVASRIRADAALALSSTLDQLGLDDLGLQIERVEGLPALAMAVDPPGDVRLALPVRDPDWARVLEQAGAAVHAALLPPGAPFEVRHLGSPSIARAYGHLFAGLAAEPAWLAAHTELTAREAAGQTEAVAARQLWSLRRSAGRLLAATDGDDSAASWRKAMERALGIEVRGAWRDREADRWLEGVDEVRGQILGAMLEAHLIELHGDRWWQEAAAGETLRDLARAGAGATPEEFARALGGSGLEAEALAHSLERRLLPVEPLAQR